MPWFQVVLAVLVNSWSVSTWLPRSPTGVGNQQRAASAVCPGCNIVLVEAKTSSFANLGTAVTTAERLGASAISNSYRGSDTSATSAVRDDARV